MSGYDKQVSQFRLHAKHTLSNDIYWLELQLFLHIAPFNKYPKTQLVQATALVQVAQGVVHYVHNIVF